jgi:membrane-bound lytic murein transglycosylase D
MRPTARLFMRVDYLVDERLDPYTASEGAARLLRGNYERLGSWPLAITAYNHGPGGMAKAVRILGTRDIGTIVARHRSPSFGFASRNFYAEFMAARRIDRDPARYFGPIRMWSNTNSFKLMR